MYILDNEIFYYWTVKVIRLRVKIVILTGYPLKKFNLKFEQNAFQNSLKVNLKGVA